MGSGDTIQFYSELPVWTKAFNELFSDKNNFQKVPSNWHVIVTDIKGSTKAVESGRHEEVNLIATGCIIAALNIARENGFTVPFFFGGDGATLIVPDAILDQVLLALNEHSKNALANFNLNLRVGSLPVEHVYEHQHELLIAKAKLNDVLNIPVIIGKGLVYAEDVIKGDEPQVEEPSTRDANLNLEGMECRWDRVKPPENTSEVVCLLLIATDTNHQASIFREVLEKIDEIYGPQHQRKPVSTERLKLKATFNKIATEMKAKTGGFSTRYLVKNLLLTLFGSFYFQFDKQGKHYINRLVELSDTLVIDGRINTVISGNTIQRVELTKVLDEMEAAGKIIYGLSISQECVMSCYVRNRDDDHIHFIDGAGAGYTQAAVVLKRKLSVSG